MTTENKTMSKAQEIKMQLLREFADCDEIKSVEFCREAYKFLTEEPIANKVQDTKQPQNGIYIVFADGSCVEYKPGVGLGKSVSGIGVIHDGHAFQVALEDFGEWPLVRNADDCPEESPFYKKECEALNDWDFVSTTGHIKEIGTDIPLPEGWYIPTLAVLEAMCFLKEQINEALEYVSYCEGWQSFQLRSCKDTRRQQPLEFQ